MRQLIRMTAFAIALVLAAPAWAQTAPIPIVDLELVPTHALPGIPVTTIATITNPGVTRSLSPARSNSS
jgi:hypothetical protein